MAEDPLCSHEPGTFDVTRLRPPQIEYGRAADVTIGWDDNARARMKKVPAFVRGMVVRRVETYCKEHGIARVTVAELERLRARMPTPKLFSGSEHE
jgi:hypothetical protein